MRISVVTVSYNSAETIMDTIESVASQSYADIEHIIVDGASTDGTLDVIKQCRNESLHVFSEPDNGIYDAMNKGIALASGDVIGFLNADDVFSDTDTLHFIANTFINKRPDACFGDLVYVKPDDLFCVTRYYSSSKFNPFRIAYGFMPAHPTLYIRNEIFKKCGVFKIDYKISGDFELVARLFGKFGITYEYIPKTLVRMRTGGVSTRSWKSNILLNNEILRACKDNDISTNLFKIYSKYFSKFLEILYKDRSGTN